MKCDTHNIVKQPICGEFRCGKCYEEELLLEPLKHMNPPTGEFVKVWDATKHREIVKVIR